MNGKAVCSPIFMTGEETSVVGRTILSVISSVTDKIVRPTIAPFIDPPVVRRYRVPALSFVLAILLFSLLSRQAAAQARLPVYVGVKACGECHDGPAMGDQWSRWLHTPHAKAYASLATPQAKQIAVLSGIPVEPQESPMCLGCHATGAEAEESERDDTFSIRDGVQCEKCHGPGSEYMDLKVMTDPAASKKAGLIIPTIDDCLKCHQEKGSHTAVLGRPPVDVTQGWNRIAHPTPQGYQFKKLEIPQPAFDAGRPKYTGAAACGECHFGRSRGYQFALWRQSKHADAWASLSTPRAAEIATQAGLKEDPRTAPACLSCHSTVHHDPAGGALEAYAAQEGVSCEACHGAGSGYSAADVMKDPAAAAKAGLKKVTRQSCQTCHAKAHGKPFDVEAAWQAIAHPTKIPPLVESVRYKTPLRMQLRPGTSELWVACEAAGTVIVVDVNARRVLAEIAVGGQPQDVAFLPDGRRALVSNRLDDTVSVVDPQTRTVAATVPVGDEPHGLLTDRAGKLLYVANTSSDSISVIDTATLVEVKRLAASRGPWAIALSPDGGRMAVTNHLSRFVPLRTAAMSEVTLLDTERGVVDDRVVLPETNLLLGAAWRPGGRFALTTMARTKNCVPMTRLTQGWTVTNGLGIVWADGRTDQVLLDEPGMAFPDPTDVVFTPDGRRAVVSSSSSDRVAVIDVDRLVAMLEAAEPDARRKIIPNHLGKASEFVIGHIPTGISPRGLWMAPDGNTVFAANALDDSLSVLDLGQMRQAARIDLGGPKEITKARYGERLFNSAQVTFHRQFSCHTCHPDGHIDGLTYDIESDGIGIDPVDNRTLRGILDTAPFKWSGANATLSRQCGARLAVHFTRLAPFTPDQLSAVDLYVCTIPRPPNRYRPLGAKLADAQRRGKLVFERTRTNDGREIPKEKRCSTCHFPPLYTDRQLHQVAPPMKYDRRTQFDVPHLNNIYDSAPYLHNGAAESLEEIWTRFNPYDQHGVTNDMTKDQLNDLIEYLKTL